MAKKRKKGKKRVNIFARIFLTLFIIIIVCTIAAAGIVIGSLFGYVEKTELIDVDNLRLNLTSFLYATDSESGETVEFGHLFGEENRIWVAGNEIPEHLKNAFVAIEDERFYSHVGFDIKRLTGAVMQYVTKDGNSSYGGSTITQQLIKNLTKDDEYSVKRKIQEIYRAYNLEKQLSKDEILEYYLNTIYLSQKCNGVASAAQTYFNKNVSDLSLAECTTIAGITQYPTKYDPLVNPENNKKRQSVILKKMLELGFITDEEYEEAIAEELVFNKKNSENRKNFNSYYLDAAIDQIIEDLAKKYDYSKEFASKLLYNGGLQIYLAVDTKMQENLERIYNEASTFQKVGGSEQPQSAMVIMDPYNGLVRALVGGRGEKTGDRTLNRATQTLRQPGSSIKPLSVYSPAIEYGLITPSTVINDAPVTFDGWSPRNDDRKFSGNITIRSALRGSRNVPASKICDYTTPQAAFDFLRDKYHLSSLVENEKRGGKKYTDVGLAQLALGGLTDGVSVIEMCAAYCAFPNGGTYRKPSTYTKVLDSNGDVLLENDEEGVAILSESTARDMISMMQDVVTGGTGTSAQLSGMRAAGKTGTTSNNHDRWFVGCTPYYVGAVWFGYDAPKKLTGFSSNPASVAWRKVMNEVHKDLKNKAFFAELDSEADKKVSVMVCEETGLRITPACKNVIAGKYSKSDVPKKRCTSHEYKFNKNNLSTGKAPAPTVKKNAVIDGIVEDEKPANSGSDKQHTENTDSQNSGNATGISENTENKPASNITGQNNSDKTTSAGGKLNQVTGVASESKEAE